METKTYALELSFKDRTVILSALEIAQKQMPDADLRAEYKEMQERLLPIFDDEHPYAANAPAPTAHKVR